MTSPRADRHLYVLGGPSDHLGYLNCERISERSHIHGWSVEAHFHEGLDQLFVFDMGKVKQQLDYAPTSIQGPAMVWLPALCIHAFDYEPGMEGWVITVPTIDLAQLAAEAPYLSHWIDKSQLVVGPQYASILAEAIELARKIESTHRELREDQNLALKSLFSLLMILLNRCLRDRETVPNDSKERPRNLARRFLSRLEDPETTVHSVAAVAGALSVTPTHLSRSVKAVTGRTASEILIDQLLLRSKRKLAFTDQSVSDIAFDLGFSSPSYFSRFFSAKTAESPRDFRKRLRSR
jgi:AraC family transcriptional regulator, transcriptional activator of pobA